MRVLERTTLPDPYLPAYPYEEVYRLLVGSPPAFSIAGITAAADSAVYMPVIFPVDCTLYAIRFVAGNGTGNYDIGLYNDVYTRLASSGSIAMSAAGIKSLTLPELRVRAGRVYYMALALSSTSGTALRINTGTVIATIGPGLGMETSAVPLPATATPVTTVGGAIPVFFFGVR